MGVDPTLVRLIYTRILSRIPWHWMWKNEQALQTLPLTEVDVVFVVSGKIRNFPVRDALLKQLA